MDIRQLTPLDPLHVRLGIPTRVDIYNMDGKLLLGRGFTVGRVDTVARLLEDGFKLANDSARAHTAQESVFRRINALAGELVALEQTLSEHQSIASFTFKMNKLTKLLLQCCDEDADAALAQCYLNYHHPYSALHHILVAVLVSVLSNLQGWSDAERLSLAAAALTHDLGVISGRSELGHAGPLTQEQRKFVHQHPLVGVELLTRLGVADPLWLQAVQDHHETLDGSGYPAGILVALDSPATLMAVADSFAAMLRPRAYRNRKLGNDIIEDLRAHAGSWYDPALVEAIATHIGHYHAGSLVRLENTDLAVVTRHRIDQPLAPQVLVIADATNQPLEKPYEVDSADPVYAIKAVLHPEISLSFRNMVNRAWGG